jgi:spoIIIJ-associated protein
MVAGEPSPGPGSVPTAAEPAGGAGSTPSAGEAAVGAFSLPTPPVAGTAADASRPARRDAREQPPSPEIVEEDTERAGDFLEGLLDALDVDGDITTWVDEVGGHIDLEGADLANLVGPAGETLDALQELTRLAVLRQTKRRVRLLLDINGFRARQREQLVEAVKATVEQVLQTREDHELEPMSPAERKIVHDAVAAIDGARTESRGEEPNRRVVIRPA